MGKSYAVGLLLALAFAGLVWVLLPPPQSSQPPPAPPQLPESEVVSTAGLPPHLQAAFGDSDAARMPEPGPGDWLASFDEPGQTYGQFMASSPLRPGAEGRKYIYIQPLGEFPEQAPKMTALQDYLAAYFHPMEVKLAKPLVVDEATIGHRVNSYSKEKQWNATDLLGLLQRQIPRDAYVVMAVTMTDLYPASDWNFVFGLARIEQRVGVFSFARYDAKDQPQLALKRAFKIISHETGHAFGVHHCTHFHCLMNGSNGLDETDRAPLQLCPICLRKLHWGLEFDPSQRYRKLAGVLRSQQMDKQAEWFSDRALKTRVSK